MLESRTNKACYIVYKYNQFNNDLEYVKEYAKAEEIQKDYRLKNKKSVYNYLVKNIDDLSQFKNLLQCKYVIIKDTI